VETIVAEDVDVGAIVSVDVVGTVVVGVVVGAMSAGVGTGMEMGVDMELVACGTEDGV
jgi:hypothetical protein